MSSSQNLHDPQLMRRQKKKQMPQTTKLESSKAKQIQKFVYQSQSQEPSSRIIKRTKMSHQALPLQTEQGHYDHLSDVGHQSLDTGHTMPNINVERVKAQKKFGQPKASTSQMIRHGPMGIKNTSPYHEFQPGSQMPSTTLAKSDSDKKLNEWSQIFSIQNSRWENEFDGVKKQFMEKLQQERDSKFLKSNKLASSKEQWSQPGFVIPNEYLPIEKRTVQPGLRGLKEKLRRDKLTARKASRAGSHKRKLSPLPRDQSSQSMIAPEKARSNKAKELSAQPLNMYQNLYNEDSPNTKYPAPFNSEVKILNTLSSKRQLPSIYIKNSDKAVKNYLSQKQIDLSRSIGSIQTENDQIQHLSKSTIEHARSRPLKKPLQVDSLGSINLNDSIEIEPNNSAYQNFYNVQQRAATEISIDQETYTHPQQKFLSSQSSKQISMELKKVFKEHPDANPFQLLLDKNPNQGHTKGLQTNHKVQELENQTRGSHDKFLQERMSQGSLLSQGSEQPININLSININNYNQANKNFEPMEPSMETIPDERKSKLRISRRKLLQPMRVVEQDQGESNFKRPNRLFHHNQPASLINLQTKVGEQNLQLEQVSKFCNVQIDNQIERERIKANLAQLTTKLEEKGLTLRDIVDAHYKQMEKMDKEKFEGPAEESMPNLSATNSLSPTSRNSTIPVRGHHKKVTSGYNSRFASLDFNAIIECSSNLKPLIAHQKRFKDEKKKFFQNMRNSQQALAKNQENSGNTQVVFDDYEKNIDDFIQNLRCLMKFSKSKLGETTITSSNMSQLHLIEDPEMYASSSGESKYSEEDRNYRDHLLQDFDALENSIKKFKNADKIVQKNQMKNNEEGTSHLVTYFNEINKAGSVPKSMGLIHRKDDPSMLNMESVLIDKVHACALEESLGKAKFVSKLILRNCGLMDAEAIRLIKAMDRVNIRHLDLSLNPQLTPAFYKELCEIIDEPACQLERLEVEGNHIGDGVTEQLIDSLLANGKIVYLNLSKCKITDVGARHVARLIQEQESHLRLLFLHDNRIMGFGGVSIAEAISVSESLQVFDISFNAICGSGLKKNIEEKKEEDSKEDKKKDKKKKRGKSVEKEKKPEKGSFAELFAQGFSEPWSNAFAKNKSLLHVDMSHNHISLQDVEIIAGGLRENHKILGFHFIGNDGDIDNQGFMHPQLPYYVSQATIFTRMQTGLKGGVVQDSRKVEFENVSHCWICEGWSEVHFTYEPGVSDENPEHDIFKPIDLRLDIDHFKPDLMLPQKRNEKVYELYRMLPPGKHKYFFTVGKEIRIAKDQPQDQVQDSDKKVKKPTLDITKTVLPSELGPDGKKKQTPVGADSKKKQSMGGGMTIKKKVEKEEDAEHDYYEMEIPKMNVTENIYLNKNLFEGDHLYRMTCVPRPGPKELGNRQFNRTPWNFQLSCFRTYRPDNAKMIDDCFELDWSRIRLPRAIPEDQIPPLKKFLKEKYKFFRETYKFQAGLDPLKDLICISNTTFSAMCQNEMGTPLGEFVDMRTLKLADVDLEVIAANAVGRPSRLNPSNYIIRHNFLEIFIRLCLQKYVKSGAAGEDGKKMSEAIQIMFQRDLTPCFSKYDSHKWRKEKLWVEEVDLTLKHGLHLLKDIYKKNCGKTAVPGAPKFMSLEEFTDLIVNANCLTENFGQKQIAVQWNLSMMTQIDEIESDKHLNMTFVEFIEALVRVAERLEIPNLIDDEITEEIEESQRIIFAKRDLPKKVESLMLFLIKTYKPKEYKKHVQMVQECKEKMVWANDIETGPMKLQ